MRSSDILFIFADVTTNQTKMNLKQFAIIILLILDSTFQVVAQNMKVIDFKLLENDLTANRYGTSKTDQNGETAALIKIVTPEKGFTFDGGSLGIVATEEHTGEIWLYVPRRAQKLIIQHQDYGVLRDYFYPIPIEGGKTYEMLIDIGTGHYASILSGLAQADIFVDGEFCGTSPVKKYLNYGRHTIRAIKDRYEGETTATITTGEGQDIRIIRVDMQDMSHLYGNVTVTVANNADIYYNGNLVGTGEWKTQLREGNYTVEARKADSDPAMTSFTVTAQQQNNIKATPPTPHTGWLSIYTRPRNVKATYNGTHLFNLTEVQTMPVGTYQVEFTRKGFVTQNHEYTVRRNETTSDTVTLERVTYVKPVAFYFGGAFTARSLSGISGILGAVFYRHDVQASYTFGLTESDIIYWEGNVNTATKYKMSSIGVKYGYQIPLMRQLAITPQVGYSYNFLSAIAAEAGNTTYGNGASSNSLSIGAKLVLAPMQNIHLFVAPEYMFTLSKDNLFTTIANNTNVTSDGFAVHVGLLANF